MEERSLEISTFKTFFPIKSHKQVKNNTNNYKTTNYNNTKHYQKYTYSIYSHIFLINNETI